MFKYLKNFGEKNPPHSKLLLVVSRIRKANMSTSTQKRALRNRAVMREKWNEAYRAPIKKGRPQKNPPRGKREAWTIVEKKCLLEGLKSYGPQNLKLIANLIGSKSEAEVQEKIFSLRGAAACDIQSTNGANNEERTSIEKWIFSLGELVRCDDIDCSLEISKALGYIAKYENFDDNQVSDLSWRNIYLYLSGLAENRTVGLPRMSDTESVILLELLTELGTSLNKMDTFPQQQILEHKIQMINAGACVQFLNRAQRTQNTLLLSQALGNEFTGLENQLVDSISGTSTSSNPSISKTSESTCSLDDVETASHSKAAYSVNPSNLVYKNEVNLNEYVGLKYSDELDKIFIKPKLFTFNPLCIPTKLLNFKLKNV
ncbi:hypothetical protein EGW08_004588 [Elysia chlorotica]|uniref:Myb-like domain-containing protein n=1 Tax=Elysia chlorotica TaxID=188477 RepID=A0A433U1I9_ELYCH|nr:hypothetical protein EGW08_004588 [Elysia chlorotica]